MAEKTNEILIYEWQKNIPTQKDKQKYDAILAKEKKLTNAQMIEKLNNETIKADKVLVRELLLKYSKPEQLNATASFAQIKSFFDLLKTNYEAVEMKYLQTEKQPQKQQKNNKQQDQNQLQENDFFEQNKTNLSKFIKDEPQHYKKCIEVNKQKVKGKENQIGIPSQKIHIFLKNFLYETKHIKMYQIKNLYFTLQDNEQKVLSLVKKYTIQVRQFPQNSFSIDQIYISEEELLTFLTFCLQDSNHFYIIYARTQKVLSKLEKQYLRRIQLRLKNNHGQKQHEPEEDQLSQKGDNITHNLQSKFKSPSSFDELPKELPSQAILRRYRQKTPNTDDEKPKVRKSLSKSLTKEQKLQKVLPDLFTFACKRRTRIHKGTTFDSIQEQSKFMNLEKFINFCNYLQINDLIGRELLIEEFKVNAINRLTLDLEKFGQVLKKLILKNNGVLDKLLSLQKLTFTKRKDNMMKILKEDQANSLSKYKYRLQPVNGKDIESIETELRQKKRLKEQMKLQKEDSLLKKKQGIFVKYQSIIESRGNRDKATSAIESNVGFVQVKQDNRKDQRSNKILQKGLNNKKRNMSQKFNPQSLISNLQQHDALWSEYQSKIWKKEPNDKGRQYYPNLHNVNINNIKNRQRLRNQSHNQSILQQALSKRIENGNKVLQKINSSNLKYYL